MDTSGTYWGWKQSGRAREEVVKYFDNWIDLHAITVASNAFSYDINGIGSRIEFFYPHNFFYLPFFILIIDTTRDDLISQASEYS